MYMDSICTSSRCQAGRSDRPWRDWEHAVRPTRALPLTGQRRQRLGKDLRNAESEARKGLATVERLTLRKNHFFLDAEAGVAWKKDYTRGVISPRGLTRQLSRR